MAIALLFGVIGAIVCASVASSKNLSVAGYALLGFLLPLIGVIIVLVAKPTAPAETNP